MIALDTLDPKHSWQASAASARLLPAGRGRTSVGMPGPSGRPIARISSQKSCPEARSGMSTSSLV